MSRSFVVSVCLASALALLAPGRASGQAARTRTDPLSELAFSDPRLAPT